MQHEDTIEPEGLEQREATMLSVISHRHSQKLLHRSLLTQIPQSHPILQIKTSDPAQPNPPALAFAPLSLERTKLSLETKQGPPGTLRQARGRAVLSGAPEDRRASCS